MDHVSISNLYNYSVINNIYNDEIYGQTSASVLTQLVMASANPTFGDNVELDSVVMSIPYFSTPTAAEGDTTFYSLDSIYGTVVDFFDNKKFIKFGQEAKVFSENFHWNKVVKKYLELIN